MNLFYFEIVERGYDRYTWVLVTHVDGRRRVIARANRDWGSPRKARKDACAIKEAIEGAEVVDNFPCPPEYSFTVLRDVLSLPVGSPDDEDSDDRQVAADATRS